MQILYTVLIVLGNFHFGSQFEVLKVRNRQTKKILKPWTFHLSCPSCWPSRLCPPTTRERSSSREREARQEEEVRACREVTREEVHRKEGE